MKEKSYKEGTFIVYYSAIGLVLGIVLAYFVSNFAFMGFGIPIGTSIGLAVEVNLKKQGRLQALNAEEKKHFRRILLYGLSILLLSILLGIVMLVQRS